MTVPEGNLEADSDTQALTSLRAAGIRADDGEDCGDFNIRIDRNGTWFYQGSPIGRIAMVKLFNTVLNKRKDGSYWLTTPVENGRIVVDDVPYVAVEMFNAGTGSEQTIDFRTNLDAQVPLDADHALRVELDPDTEEPAPYIHVGKGLEARIARSVFYHLVEIGEDRTVNGDTRFGVWSRGSFYPLDGRA